VSDPRGIQRSVSRSNSQTTAVEAAYEGDLHGGSLDYTRISVTREVEPSTVFTSSRAATAAGTATGEKFESSINAFGASGKLSVGRRMVLNARATYTDADFTTKSAGASAATTSTSQVPFASGFTGYETSLGLTRELPNETIVTGTGSWSLRDPKVGEDMTIWRGQLGATRQVTPSIYGEVNAGFVLVHGAVEFSGPVATVKVTYAGPSIRATLSGGQTVQETFAQSVNVGLVQTRDVIASLTYSPTDRLQVNLGGGIVNTEFLQPDVAASQGVTATTTSRRPDSTLYTLNVSLTMNLTKVFTLYLGYDHRTREVDEQKGARTTSFTITNFDANTFTVRLTGTYQ
jgi:hypothetical protein